MPLVLEYPCDFPSLVLWTTTCHMNLDARLLISQIIQGLKSSYCHMPILIVVPYFYTNPVNIIRHLYRCNGANLNSWKNVIVFNYLNVLRYTPVAYNYCQITFWSSPIRLWCHFWAMSGQISCLIKILTPITCLVMQGSLQPINNHSNGTTFLHIL